jgi:hypothetical protein
MLGTCKNSTDFKYNSGAENDNKNSSTPNGSKFVSTKTEQAAENQEEYFTIYLSG